MSRCEEVKSVGGAAAGRGALTRKPAASGHMGTGRKEGTGGRGAGGWNVDCLVGEDAGVEMGVEVVC